MSQAVLLCTFPLKEGISVPDFLHASETLNHEFISKQKGFVSWQQLRGSDVWANAITFESMEDLENFKEASNTPNTWTDTFFFIYKLEPRSLYNACLYCGKKLCAACIKQDARGQMNPRCFMIIMTTNGGDRYMMITNYSKCSH